VCECSPDEVYKLWRIFNCLAETSDEADDVEATVPVMVHADEVELLVQRLGVILRTAVTYDAGGRPSSFTEFLRTVETTCLAGKNASVISSTVGQLYDDIIANVLKKVRIGQYLNSPVPGTKRWFQAIRDSCGQLYRDESFMTVDDISIMSCNHQSDLK